MENLILIKTLAELKALQVALADKDFIALDTETTGIEKDSEIIGVSVAADVDTGYYIVLSEWIPEEKFVDESCAMCESARRANAVTSMCPACNGTGIVSRELKGHGHLNYLETKAGIKEFLQSLVGRLLLMHNAGFDCWMISNNYGVELMPSVHTDTLVLAHLLDENRACGLKDLGVAIFGEDAKKEQAEMKESVAKNGGVLTKQCFELYKGDADLIGRYGAKDAILTLKLFFHFIPDLYEQGLDQFFYEDETMPMLRGPTYELNTTGLKVDTDRLSQMRGVLESEIMEAKAFVHAETKAYIVDKYPGTNKGNTFNINAGKQLAWLLFIRLGNDFNTLTQEGRDLCYALEIKIPYSPGDRREFIRTVTQNKGEVWRKAGYFDRKTKKTLKRDKVVTDPWNYISSDKATLKKLQPRYKWVERLLELKKNEKILTTYVIGIQERMKYGVIRPSFLQHGTTSGRYSSRNPNFQNLPRDDKRVKACIISRPGKVLVGADYSQLEPRVFASFSGDERLLACFRSADDFYSVIGMEVFEKTDCVPLKEGQPDAFGIKYKKLRDIAKTVALSSTYGTTAFKMAPVIGKTTAEAQEVIDSYFRKFPSVRKLMLESHEMAKRDGQVVNLFGRPRRMPKAKAIPQLFGKTPHSELEYEWRNLLNLSINHRIQSTGASIMNRAAIAFYKSCRDLEELDPTWKEVKLVMQVHDELIVECPESLGEDVVKVLKYCMEETVQLPGVALEAQPKIGRSLAELK